MMHLLCPNTRTVSPSDTYSRQDCATAAAHGGQGMPSITAIGTNSWKDCALLDSTCWAYETHRTWEENLLAGLPKRCRKATIPKREWPPEDKWIDFLGHKVASPLGVAAGPLLSSDWVALAANHGYDILTYKTIRSHHHAGHGLPNILHLEAPEQLPAICPSGSRSQSLSVRPRPPAPGEPLAITNSFGMPSQGPQQLREDIPRAQAALRRGQMLVVSVTGTAGGRAGVTFLEDLAATAHLAAGAAGEGAVVELNLSCPNVGSAHCLLCQDPKAVETTVAAVRGDLGPSVPLVIKVGAYPDQEALRHVLTAAARAGAAAVAGINGLSRQVEAADGSPALGPCRLTSGVCGDPIRQEGLRFVQQARQVIAAEGLSLGLIGVGGVTKADHAMDYLRAGADVVQAATGFMWRPSLGSDFQHLWAREGYTRPVADGRGGRA